jgi:hypothetical protein
MESGTSSVQRKKREKNVSQTGQIPPASVLDDVRPDNVGTEPEGSDRTGIIRYVHAPDPCSKYRPPGLSDVDDGSLDSVCAQALQLGNSHLTHCYARDASRPLWTAVENAKPVDVHRIYS